MQYPCFLIFLILAVGCSPTPPGNVVVVDQKLNWRKMDVDNSTITGRGTSTLTIRSIASQPVTLAFSGGTMDSVAIGATTRSEVSSPVPDEVRQLFPCTLQSGQSISATFKSGGKFDTNKSHKVRLSSVVDGKPVVLEGTVNAQFH